LTIITLFFIQLIIQ